LSRAGGVSRPRDLAGHDDLSRQRRGLRILLGAFGDPGHAFPMLALGEALVARGHAVALQTWRRWEEAAVAAGMTFAAAPEYQVFPTRERPLKPYAAAVRAAGETRPVVRSFAPDVAVSDVLTPAPAYAIGARLPRTAFGRALWSRSDRLVARGLEQGRREYNDCRARLGLPPLPYVHTGMSRSLTLVATLPQLEYPRDWPAWCRVVGPLLWEPPGERVAPPPGTGPVVLVAPSTAQDPEHRLLRASLAGLADERVRIIATYNGREPSPPVDVPPNAVLVPWLSYSQTMPSCDLVIAHGGHGTLVRALSCGCPLLLSPAGGDMGENAARADWAGFAVRLPRRYCTPRGVRLAVRRALSRPDLAVRARRAADWIATHAARDRAAAEIEHWAETGAPMSPGTR
jgi:UDP:flavonoid glycosyltransferase YjiC (YdhE family)